MNKKSRAIDLLIVTALIVAVVGISHFVVVSPLGPSRLLYHIQLPLIQWTTKCSDGAPAWMANIQQYSAKNMTAPASQLAFIAPDSDELYHCETGWKDGVFGDELLQSKARFRFASTTKTVTAIAVLNLIANNALSMDDTVVDVLELGGDLQDPRVGDITIEHLLSHRAGWDRLRTQDVMFMKDVKPWCPYDPEQLATTSLLNAPGEVKGYSNVGYCLLGLVIEKVTGQKFREYISEYFDFESGTLAFIDGRYLDDEVVYDFRHENFYTETYFENFDFNSLSSSAGLSGSASDLAILVRQSLKSEPLTILDGGMANNCDPAQIQSCYGYGVYRYQPASDTMPLFIHEGKLPGATSVVIVDPMEGVLVWLGAGAVRPGVNAHQNFYDHIREALVHHYQ